MPKQVINGAMLKCDQGVAPATLTVLPVNQTDGDDQPAATVMDFKPMVNIASFGMCQSTANPAVIAATSAAGGAKTPAPCVPATTSPWTPGSSIVTIQDQKALTDDSKCMCTWAGQITVQNPGQSDIEIE